MKKALAIAGILALSITPTASFSDHIEPSNNEIRHGGSLFHTNLRGRNLNGTNLSNANLSGADLRGANLSGANLSRANLSDATLTDANPRFANLMNANLSDANLTGVTATNLRGCPGVLPSGWVCENNSFDADLYI